MDSYCTHYIHHSPDHIVVTAQVLDASFCMLQASSPLAIWAEIAIDIVRITLGALMCLLVAIQFVRQSLQMYRVTKQFELSRYMNLLVREGMFYFLAYVHIPLLFLLPPH